MAGYSPARRSTVHRWLLVLPFGWQILAAPLVNDVRFAPMHIPFPMFWQMLGIVLTTVVVSIVFVLDRRAGVDDEEAEFLEKTGSEL
jgi:hypothetical protein